jgi:hypothetical protein
MEYMTIWSIGYRVRAALTVTIVAESEKAIQFQVADNPKIKLWFPRKALNEVNGALDRHFELARWFTFNDFTRNVFDRYASHY